MVNILVILTVSVERKEAENNTSRKRPSAKLSIGSSTQKIWYLIINALILGDADTATHNFI